MSDVALTVTAPIVVRQRDARAEACEIALQQAQDYAESLGDWGLRLMIGGAQRELPKAETRLRERRRAEHQR